MSRQKKQGTDFETAVVTLARTVGLTARRIAEGGSADEGDVEVHDRNGRRWVVECKAREALSLHPAFARAAAKVPAGDGHALAWKRLVKVPGRTRRVAAGPALVALTVPEFLLLLSNQRDDGLPPG